jgi:hypothetical protein
MKQPPKPFAIEIKRSRRAPAAASPMDLFGKDSFALTGANAGLFSRREASSNPPPNPADDSDFAVPAFLQTDRATPRALELSKEAEQLFMPKPTAPLTPAAPAGNSAAAAARPPRILPSLVEPVGASVDALAAAETPPRAARQSRRSEAPARKSARAPQADRANTIEAPAMKRRMGEPASGGAQAGSASARTKRKPAAAWSVAPVTANPAPPPVATPSESGVTHLAANGRGVRARGLARRREEAAALPPGQHWKRRINPHAW